MGMLSVCYAKVKIMLNRRKVEMLSLGYGNIKVRLRQIALLLASMRAGDSLRYSARVRTHIGAESWELGAE